LPIRSDGFFERLQIDLVDTRHNKCTNDGRTYAWIAHVIDHFSKYNVLWAQDHKTADEVVRGLLFCIYLFKNVFAFFGCLAILQSDNGLEFRNSLMLKLVKSWDGNCKVVYGRPRHPQSQGLVEQSNGTMERMISAMTKQFNDNNWVAFLPKIMYNMNTQLNCP
jgi:hypothetical protein